MEATPETMESTSPLQKLFMKILNGENLFLDLKAVLPVLSEDLGINLELVSAAMKCVLGEVLCFFMTRWPGWASGRIHYPILRKQCFEAYKKYLREKVMFVHMNQVYYHNRTRFSRKEADVQKTEKQLSIRRRKLNAYLNMELQDAASFLNGMLITWENGDFIKKNRDEKPWNPLKLPSMSYFLNHPFLKVTVKLPKAEFSRSNIHEFRRFITDGDELDIPSETAYITEITKLFPNDKCKVYTFSYILSYINQLSFVFFKNNISNAMLIQCFLRQYIQDVEECNLYGWSMASPFRVAYNIGRKMYARKRKLDADIGDRGMNFYEIVIPKVSLELPKFNVEATTTHGKLAFKDLNEIFKIPKKMREPTLYQLNNCLTLTCTMCNIDFCGENCDSTCIDHFQTKHKGDDPVACTKCHQMFDILNLAAARWSHNCQKK